MKLGESKETHCILVIVCICPVCALVTTTATKGPTYLLLIRPPLSSPIRNTLLYWAIALLALPAGWKLPDFDNPTNETKNKPDILL